MFHCFIVSLFHNNIISQESESQIIVKFNYSYLNFDEINDINSLVLPFKSVLNDRSKEQLKNLELLYPGISNYQITKIFPFLRTTDTVSISRLGEKITIPPFWATFTMTVPPHIDVAKLMRVLDNFNPLIEYCHYNFPAYTASPTTPSDTLYDKQISLNGSALHPNAGINIENAWTIETGKSFVKVGVHDSGIDTIHPDIDVVFGGGYFTANNSIAYEWGKDKKGHGTPVAGIIGAKRDNITGIAGIAGGDTIPGSGCSLFDLRLDFPGQGLSSYICASVVDAARSVNTYWDYPANYYDEFNPYFEHTPGFGVNIGNHSYIIKTGESLPQEPSGGGDDDEDDGSKIVLKDVNDSTVAFSPICTLCREAYLFSLKNGVINVVSRGNSQQFSPSLDPTLIDFVYPQSFPDNWLISVGASGYDGYTVQNGLNQSFQEEQGAYWSMYGGNMDLIAPGSDSIVYTLSMVNPVTEPYPYEKFNGTSAAAPHVTGVVALLLSHYNKDCYTKRNLSVEDIEYILEHSATNLYEPGYDDTTGWGRLDAYKALQMIENPTKQIIHPDSLISSVIVSRDTIALSYQDAFVADGWGPISSTMPLENNKYYQVERVLVQNTYSFAEYMLSSTTLNDVWLRPSASNSLDFYNDTSSYLTGPGVGILEYIFDAFDYMPFEEMDSVDTILFQVKTKGFYYHFISRYDEAYFPTIFIDTNILIDTWLPLDPISDTAKMLFSIYITDTTLTSIYDFPCTSDNPLYDDNYDLGLQDLAKTNFILYPNPSNESITIKGVENQVISKVEIFDLNGKILYSKYPNVKQLNIDISNYQQGAYFVKCSDENTSRTLKLMKL